MSLKDLLKELKVTQASLAEALDVDKAVISDICNGKVELTEDFAKQIAESLDVGLEDVFTPHLDDKDPPEDNLTVTEDNEEAKAQLSDHVLVESTQVNPLFLNQYRWAPNGSISVPKKELETSLFKRYFALGLIKLVKG